jgi:hypothetical protein
MPERSDGNPKERYFVFEMVEAPHPRMPERSDGNPI